MSCQDRVKLSTETSQNLGAVCPDETPDALNALNKLREDIAKGSNQARDRLSWLEESAEAGDILAYRLLLQAAAAPETLTKKTNLQNVVSQTAMDLIFSRNMAAIENPSPYVVAMLKGTRPNSCKATWLAIRALREMRTTPDERAYLIGRIVDGLDAYKKKTGKPMPLTHAHHNYFDQLALTFNKQGDLFPIFIDFPP